MLSQKIVVIRKIFELSEYKYLRRHSFNQGFHALWERIANEGVANKILNLTHIYVYIYIMHKYALAYVYNIYQMNYKFFRIYAP